MTKERLELLLEEKELVAKRKIKQGEKLTEENITTKRPGVGVDPIE